MRALFSIQHLQSHFLVFCPSYSHLFRHFAHARNHIIHYAHYAHFNHFMEF